MHYKLYLIIFLTFFIFGCENKSINNTSSKIKFETENRYKNSGFGLIYNDNLKDIKSLENRSLDIYHKYLKKKSTVKITNPDNGKYVFAVVKSNKIKFIKQ